MGVIVFTAILLFGVGMLYVGRWLGSTTTYIETYSCLSAKYNIGDTVYLFYNELPTKGTINKAYIEYTKNEYIERYSVIVNDNDRICLSSKKLFKSKEDMIIYIDDLSIFK